MTDGKLIEQLRDDDSYYRVQEKHWCIDAEELERQRLAAADRIEQLTAEVERLREVLGQIADGTMPRPLGEPWRMDQASSKHDRCVHGAWMYEPCEGCIDAFISAALEGKQ